jgi:hypothetical protein
VEVKTMIYDYVYELFTTLFIDPDLISDEALIFLEIMMIYISAIIFKFMLYPVGVLFRIAATQYKNIGGAAIRTGRRRGNFGN